MKTTPTPERAKTMSTLLHNNPSAPKFLTSSGPRRKGGQLPGWVSSDGSEPRERGPLCPLTTDLRAISILFGFEPKPEVAAYPWRLNSLGVICFAISSVAENEERKDRQ